MKHILFYGWPRCLLFTILASVSFVPSAAAQTLECDPGTFPVWHDLMSESGYGMDQNAFEGNAIAGAATSAQADAIANVTALRDQTKSDCEGFANLVFKHGPTQSLGGDCISYQVEVVFGNSFSVPVWEAQCEFSADVEGVCCGPESDVESELPEDEDPAEIVEEEPLPAEEEEVDPLLDPTIEIEDTEIT